MTTTSHAQFLSRYTAALPADVQATIQKGGVAYRIAGLRTSVLAEIDRITAELETSPGAWSAVFTQPVKWGDEYVVHGEVRYG